MALEEDARIVNAGNSKIFIFRGVAAKPKKTQPVIPIPLISNTPENTFLFRFFGQLEMITFSFVIVDDGTDVSAGTGSSSISGVNQQIRFLNNEIFTALFDDTWNLTVTSVYGISTISGVIVDLDFDVPIGRPAIRTGTLTFHRGKILPT